MRKTRVLDFKSEAPDLCLLRADGVQVRLSSLWADKALLLAFARHFGCTQCKEMLSEIVEGKDRIEGAGLGIAVVTQGSPQAAAEFGKKHAPGLLVLSDPERAAYRAYGLERGSIFQVALNPRVFRAVSRAKKKGYRLELPPEGQDAMQMSGIFVINRAGRIALPYYYDDIADHPSLDILLSGVLSTDWDAPFDGAIGPGGRRRR
jgi:peroxiredoxin